MIRRTLTILSLSGLLLSVGLWGVSYGNCGYVSGITFWAVLDGVVIRGVPLQDVHPPRWVWGGRGASRFAPPLWSPHILHNDFGQLLWVSLPLWMPTFFFVIVFFFSYDPLLRSRRKRKKLGLCVKCGYDLTGLPEPRCPECNTQFEKT